MLSDPKPAGCESQDIVSGYAWMGTVSGYKEIGDEEIRVFLSSLPMGEYQISHRLRAERPGRFSALPPFWKPCTLRNSAATAGNTRSAFPCRSRNSGNKGTPHPAAAFSALHEGHKCTTGNTVKTLAFLPRRRTIPPPQTRDAKMEPGTLKGHAAMGAAAVIWGLMSPGQQAGHAGRRSKLRLPGYVPAAGRRRAVLAGFLLRAPGKNRPARPSEPVLRLPVRNHLQPDGLYRRRGFHLPGGCRHHHDYHPHPDHDSGGLRTPGNDHGPEGGGRMRQRRRGRPC